MPPTPEPSKLIEILKQGHRHILPKGQIIQVTDRNVLFFIMSGYVKRYLITNSGVESIQGIFGPSEIFPLTSVFRVLLHYELSHRGDMYFYEAMTAAKIFSIGESELIAAVENDSLLYKDLLIVSGERLNSNIAKLSNVALSSAYSRIAHALVDLAENYALTDGQDQVIQLPLTHQDIASILNLARETVSTVLHRLKTEGLIDTNKKLLTIHDIEKLKHKIK